MKMRGFSTIGFVSQKDTKNTGSLLRAAHAYDVGLVVFQSPRDTVRDYLNTSKAERHIPVVFGNIKDIRPYGAKIVAVEFVKEATPLPEFEHPEQAFYVFGPENSSIPEDVMEIADEVVYVPTSICMNLACAANVVLYDRMCKGLIKKSVQ